MKFSQEQIDDTIISNNSITNHIEKETTLQGDLSLQLTEFECNTLKTELSRVDKQFLGYFPIEDNNSNFDLVIIKTEYDNVQSTPHCKIHGAMNCVAVHKNGKLWRCIQSKDLKDCRAGCEERYEEN